MNLQIPNHFREDGTKKLLELYRKLPQQDRKTLVDLAEFLAARCAGQKPEPIPEPEKIPRSQDESVVKAIKRLSATYFMLDKSAVLNEASALMAQHVMQGRPASQVIDELEELFETHYQRLCEDAE